ncbi:glycogen/starch/alpha-glucan phosphorylase [Acidithiobacillus sp.]|uniref:glycogen/starch/alpha-glucan phosphorylase n=1 Tax=Acidithiobacillus sp. TaxID=1872118 RepID=UPI00258362D9|nr:glycogen/starch/alpha-glucan phosphorylase [Acidithiobacillus sp.]MDD5374846.1 glycogen/starch/alpha-glucan phosphorylase [Acidithiobacillus sp.]
MSSQPLSKTACPLPPLGMDALRLRMDTCHYLLRTLGAEETAEPVNSVYTALAMSLRDRLVERWKNTQKKVAAESGRRTFYLSLEFLLGRAMGNTLLNLGLEDAAREALTWEHRELVDIMELEPDAGLGNGGLGRLAACFLDSCASLGLPVTGYGIRYSYGMFRQEIRGGEQVEEPDHWLRNGCPWELKRPERIRRVHFFGRSDGYHDAQGRFHQRWVDTHDVLAVPYDIPIPGYRNEVVNTLRLWRATATDIFDLGEFNAGAYPEAVAAKNNAEHISMVLYPNDSSENGKELRLRQQYFLASASLQDVVADWVAIHGEDFRNFAKHHCFQLNDTHPSCAVPELMRLLMDEHGLSWEEAWDITSHTMAYTNHTLLPEALERWSVRLFRQLLPRLLEIIMEINARFLQEVARRAPGNTGLLQRLSIIEEGDEQMVRMAHLAVVGSFSVNGVAALHTRLLCEDLFADFHHLWPTKFNNKTNGVTPRRWLQWANPGLRDLITERIGPDWKHDLERLRDLEPAADDATFRKRWAEVRRANKERLATLVHQHTGVTFIPEALVDVQVKRVHEYKRQLLNALHVIHLYDRIKRGEANQVTPRNVLFAGKAAPGYFMAKRTIKLINNIANVINHDPDTEGLLRVSFLPDYRVSLMEQICAATDLSEQISTAGKEASGTGNMKFMMNGALTIGTLDGANIEIRDAVGAEHFFLFGLNAEEVSQLRGHYHPELYIQADHDLARVMDLLQSGYFNAFEPGIFDPIVHAITHPHDPWMVLADFTSYKVKQREAADVWHDQTEWQRLSILNTAASGIFSSDRTIAQYNADIWHLTPLVMTP